MPLRRSLRRIKIPLPVSRRNYEAGSPWSGLGVGLISNYERAYPARGVSRPRLSKRRPVMKILALDLGKFKTVACAYEAESARHRFVSVVTTPQALHDLIVEVEPDRVVIEICSIAGW